MDRTEWQYFNAVASTAVQPTNQAAFRGSQGCFVLSGHGTVPILTGSGKPNDGVARRRLGYYQ